MALGPNLYMGIIGGLTSEARAGHTPIHHPKHWAGPFTTQASAGIMKWYRDRILGNRYKTFIRFEMHEYTNFLKFSFSYFPLLT